MLLSLPNLCVVDLERPSHKVGVDPVMRSIVTCVRRSRVLFTVHVVMEEGRIAER